MDVRSLKQLLVSAGLEVYRTRGNEIHIAERVRLHIMDSGIGIRLEETEARVFFRARAQHSDAPHAAPEWMLNRLRETVGPIAAAKGFAETSVDAIEVRDPSNPDRVLDVWHEIAYEKVVQNLDTLSLEVQSLLQVERFVSP